MLKRTPLKPRKKPLKRGKAPTRSPLVRKVVQKIKSRGRSRFPKHRQPAYKAWIKTLPCLLTGKSRTGCQYQDGSLVVPRHHCFGPIDPMHIKSQGAGADDYGALVPCCHLEHDRSHHVGIQTWARQWFGETDTSTGLDELRRIAAEVYPREWEKHKALGFPE